MPSERSLCRVCCLSACVSLATLHLATPNLPNKTQGAISIDDARDLILDILAARCDVPEGMVVLDEPIDLHPALSHVHGSRRPPLRPCPPTIQGLVLGRGNQVGLVRADLPGDVVIGRRAIRELAGLPALAACRLLPGGAEVSSVPGAEEQLIRIMVVLQVNAKEVRGLI